MRDEHVHPHYVRCDVKSNRGTQCFADPGCGHALPHQGGGEYWNDEGEDMDRPTDEPKQPGQHEHRCLYEQDEVAHVYCRCLCGWWCGPEAHQVSDYFPKTKAERTAWHPAEEDH